MKFIFVGISLVSFSLLIDKETENYEVIGSKCIARNVVLTELNYTTSFDVKWFNKDLNLTLTRNLRTDNGC